MSEPKWTPGDWQRDYGDIGDDSSRPYCVVHVNDGEIILADVNDRFDQEQGRANARLFASAKALYRALEAICDELLNGGEAGAIEAYAIAKHAGRAALAKAADGGEG